MKDKYDLAIEYFTEHPEEIQHAWNEPFSARHGCLFVFLRDDLHFNCGCPTQVKSHNREAQTKELTQAVRALDLPSMPLDITVDNLPAFAEAQRLADRMLNRTDATATVQKV